jgi:hypothetical protein
MRFDNLDIMNAERITDDLAVCEALQDERLESRAEAAVAIEPVGAEGGKRRRSRRGTPPPMRKAGPSSDWYPLEAHLEEMLEVVRPSGIALERTTILTWMYQREGSISFEELASLVQPDVNKTQQKRMARRVLRALHKIKTIALRPLENAQGDDDESDAAGDEGDADGVSINLNTGAYITSAGMTWLRRAWNARYTTLKTSRGTLLQTHRLLLAEEEEGKGNEPFWLETLGGNSEDDPDTLPSERAGEVTSWIKGPVASVFDLHLTVGAMSKR